MAASTSGTSDMMQEMGAITTCAICLGEFDKPKSLPCLHTFCSGCLNGAFKDKPPRSKASCPQCRQAFKIPRKGLESLPDNFIVKHVIETLKAKVSHPLEHEQNASCEKHPGKPLNRYCFKCKTSMCVKCFGVSHRQNRCRETELLANGLQKQIDADIDSVKLHLAAALHSKSQLTGEEIALARNVAEVKKAIRQQAEKMKAFIDAQANELLSKLRELKVEASSVIDSQMAKITPSVLELKSQMREYEKLKKNWRPTDIKSSAKRLHTNAERLLKTDVKLPENIMITSIVFMPSDTTQIDFIGHLTTREIPVSFSQLVKIPSTDQPIAGVTSLENKVYVLRCKDKDQIEIYDATSLSFVKCLFLPELKICTGASADIASCKDNHCLYVVKNRDSYVHRIDQFDAVATWAVNDSIHGVSVTPRGTVLANCYKAFRLKEFTTDGKQLREIILQPNLVNVLHAVQLTSGEYLVCHGGRASLTHRVCKIDANGNVLSAYGGPKGGRETVGQLCVPYHLATDAKGFIYVTDLNNYRVLVLDPALGYVGKITLCDKSTNIHINAESGILYIAESKWIGDLRTSGCLTSVNLHKLHNVSHEESLEINA